MSSKAQSFKVGVLNMTICFEHSKQRVKFKRENEPRLTKMHAVPVFIPRYSAPRQTNNLSTDKNREQLSPYQRYLQAHKQSIRYFRQHFQSTKQQKNIQGLSPRNNKTIQLQFNDSFVDQQRAINAPKQSNDGHLRLVFNKRHLRNTMDLQGQSKTQSIAMCFNGNSNPEENLKNIFTVRTIDTSVRKRKACSKQEEKVKYRITKTKQQTRLKEQKWSEDSGMIQKNLRPWSPARNFFNKDVMFQPEILVPL